MTAVGRTDAVSSFMMIPGDCLTTVSYIRGFLA
jgi:hypothetical protein